MLQAILWEALKQPSFAQLALQTASAENVPASKSTLVQTPPPDGQVTLLKLDTHDSHSPLPGSVVGVAVPFISQD